MILANLVDVVDGVKVTKTEVFIFVTRFALPVIMCPAKNYCRVLGHLAAVSDDTYRRVHDRKRQGRGAADRQHQSESTFQVEPPCSTLRSDTVGKIPTRSNETKEQEVFETAFRIVRIRPPNGTISSNSTALNPRRSAVSQPSAELAGEYSRDRVGRVHTQPGRVLRTDLGKIPAVSLPWGESLCPSTVG
jgi:hypothetical protein